MARGLSEFDEGRHQMDNVLAIAVVVLIAALGFMLIRRAPSASSSELTSVISAKLDSLDSETRRVNEQLVRLESIPQALNTLQQRSAELGQRLAAMEAVPTTVANLRIETNKVTERLQQFDPVTKALEEVRATVAEIRTSARERQGMDNATAESVRRLEMVIAGTQSRGAAGENMIEVILTALPVEWQVRDFRIQNLVVEFGLRLPSGLVLPIDSKWTGADLITKFADATEPAERLALKKQIEQAVLGRAKDIEKYIDPDQTPGFGIAVVPDAVYDLCLAISPGTFSNHRVIVVSYSLLVPYLLMIVQTAMSSSQTIDVQKLDSHLAILESTLTALQREIDSRLSRALKALTNSREAMAGLLGRARSSIANVRLIGAATGGMALPEIGTEPVFLDDSEDDLLEV